MVPFTNLISSQLIVKRKPIKLHLHKPLENLQSTKIDPGKNSNDSTVLLFI